MNHLQKVLRNIWWLAYAHFFPFSNRDKLPDDHPDKPKGFFEQAVAKAQASLEAEAAAFAGCKVEIMVRFPFYCAKLCFSHESKSLHSFVYSSSVNVK